MPCLPAGRIKTSLCESAAVADVHKFLISLYSDN